MIQPELSLPPRTILVVRLERGLDWSRRVGIFSAIKLLPGVELVADAAVLSEDTLELLAKD